MMTTKMRGQEELVLQERTQNCTWPFPAYTKRPATAGSSAASLLGQTVKTAASLSALCHCGCNSGAMLQPSDPISYTASSFSGLPREAAHPPTPATSVCAHVQRGGLSLPEMLFLCAPCPSPLHFLDLLWVGHVHQGRLQLSLPLRLLVIIRLL